MPDGTHRFTRPEAAKVDWSETGFLFQALTLQNLARVGRCDRGARSVRRPIQRPFVA